MPRNQDFFYSQIPQTSHTTHICDAGLEFHGEVIGKDGDLLDELFDQSLIKLCDVSFLLGDVLM